MRSITIAIILLSSIKAWGQDIPENTRHIKYVDAVIYSLGDTSEYNRSVTYYDSTWKVLTNTNTLASVLTKGTLRVTVIDREDKKMYSDINPDGDTTSSIVYLYDIHGNRTAYYQIRNGDTINRQKRTYDKSGNNVELWNYKNNNYFLKYKATFDDSNNVIKRIYFDSYGQVTKTTTTKRNYKKGTIKSYEQVPGSPKKQTFDIKIVDGVSRSKHLRSAEGINYGITIIKEVGGYTESQSKNDNLVWMKIYDSDNNLTTSVEVTYEEYP